MKKKLFAIFSAAVLMICGVGCGDGSNADVSSEQPATVEPTTVREIPEQIKAMVGTYSVDDVSVINTGKELGLKESDFNVCKKVEITENGTLICYGLFDDKEFPIVFKEGDNYYNLFVEEFTSFYDKEKGSYDYVLPKEYIGPTLVGFAYSNVSFSNKGDLHVYVKTDVGTDGWYAYLKCKKD